MAKLKLLPLGGMGRVTQNMYLYQYEQEIVIIDCGIGFPDLYMPGVDTLIPDISYLQDQIEAGAKIVGMILSHGHDDHIGALPYILPDLPDFPIFASPLTAGFANDRLIDKKLNHEITVVQDKQTIKLGQYFAFEFLAMTHSVPDTKHIIFTTPVGTIYHGSDFKLDKNPVDGVKSDMERIEQVGKDGVLLTLLDCLRIERTEWTESESSVAPALLEEMSNVRGKILVTLMSSHLHRIQQVINACQQLDRKVAFVGRSVEQNVKVAALLKKLHIPKGMQIDKKEIADTADKNLCVIIAGSQGQEGSSLVRAVYGEHQVVQITAEDKVIFSADVIPGNEINYFAAIDELAANNVEVVYPDINPAIHWSGHASKVEQEVMVELLKSKYLMPIGGADRHRALFKKWVAKPLGYQESQVLLPSQGQVLGIDESGVKVVDEVYLNSRTVDGLGIGDVGPVVLSDRLSLSKAGMIVLVMPRRQGQFDLQSMRVVSRGFVFMKEADEVIKFIKEQVIEVLNEFAGDSKDDELKKKIERRLAKKLYRVIKREPMIVPVIVDV